MRPSQDCPLEAATWAGLLGEVAVIGRWPGRPIGVPAGGHNLHALGAQRPTYLLISPRRSPRSRGARRSQGRAAATASSGVTGARPSNHARSPLSMNSAPERIATSVSAYSAAVNAGSPASTSASLYCSDVMSW